MQFGFWKMSQNLKISKRHQTPGQALDPIIGIDPRVEVLTKVPLKKSGILFLILNLHLISLMQKDLFINKMLEFLHFVLQRIL